MLMGNIYGDLGEHQKQTESLQAALVQLVAAGDRRSEANCLRALAEARFDVEDFEEAEQKTLAAISLAAELDDDVGKNTSLQLLGRIHFHKGLYEDAVACFTKSGQAFGAVSAGRLGA